MENHEKILAQTLNEAQFQAATSMDKSVLVVAGAGSGKTRTIVSRLAWLAGQGVDPSSMLLLTFTRKAAREMLDRAALMMGYELAGVQGGTFHGFAFSVLRRFRPAWLGDRPFTIMDSGDITAAVKQCKDSLKLGKGDRSFPKTQAIVGMFSKARNKEISLEEVVRRDAFHLLPHCDDLAKLSDAYTTYRRDKGLLDYDDLLFELEALLRDNPSVADILHQRFGHILVDEYQDTNLVQARLVRLLTGENAYVMAVGDEAQSIYAFRGANVRNILDFPKLFPGTRVIRLEENYRSTQPILNVANCLLENAAESFKKTLFTRKEGGELVRLFRPMSDLSQARVVVKRIQELLQDYLPEEIAVLFRAGFHSFNLELALNQAGIRFSKYGGLRYAEAAHVKDCVAFARLVINPLDMPAFARVAAMHEGIGPKTVDKLYTLLATGGADGEARAKSLKRYPGLLDDLQFIDGLRANGGKPADVLASVLEHYQPRLAMLYPDDWPHRQQALEEIVRMAADYTSLDLFVAELALDNPDMDERERQGRVVLSTVHSAKGLEWKAVLLIDLVEDRFPSRHAITRPEDYEEERRLMYVACTRARNVLELYAPATIFSRADHSTVPAAQSPFVRELGSDLTETWVEQFNGSLLKTGAAPAGSAMASPRPSSLVRPAQPTARPLGAALSGMQQTTFADDQRDPQDDAEPRALGERRPGEAPAASGALCYCQHRIFGRGKILRHIDADKVQVNFPGFGLKVILKEYLIMESS